MGQSSGSALAGSDGAADLSLSRSELDSISGCSADRIAVVSVLSFSVVSCGCCSRCQPGVGLSSRGIGRWDIEPPGGPMRIPVSHVVCPGSGGIERLFSCGSPAIIVVTLAKRPVREDLVTVYGIVSALFVVGLVLTFLVSLGFLVGTLLRKPLLAVVVLIFVWYPISLILSIFSLEQFSPVSLSRAVSTQLRQSWRQSEDEAKAAGTMQDMEQFSEQFSSFLSRLSGAPARPKTSKGDFFETKEFKDFSLFRVTLGYGLPTLAAVILATLCFYWRDL